MSVACTGHPAPDWLDDLDSIEQEATHYSRVQQKIDEWGSLVVHSIPTIDVNDRVTGKIYWLFASKKSLGDVIEVDYQCQTQCGSVHVWRMYLKVIRKATLAEVRKMAKQRRRGEITVTRGHWYEVYTD